MKQSKRKIYAGKASLKFILSISKFSIALSNDIDDSAVAAITITNIKITSERRFTTFNFSVIGNLIKLTNRPITVRIKRIKKIV